VSDSEPFQVTMDQMMAGLLEAGAIERVECDPALIGTDQQQFRYISKEKLQKYMRDQGIDDAAWMGEEA
jgi:hypothetical protein